MLDFWQRHWFGVLVLIVGLLALPSTGPTFSANSHELTIPRGLFGLLLVVLATVRLVSSWRQEQER